MSKEQVFKQIEGIINENKITLFMKGTADFPQCGFSSMVANILQNIGAEFKDINVLATPELREGIKEFSDWPTIPQLYINQEFVGGCDIVRELYENGELEKIIWQEKTISKEILHP